MKEYRYKGFSEPIKVNENGESVYRGHKVEKYFHGYNAVGMASGFSASQLSKSHYIEEMKRIDENILREEYKANHPEEYEKLETADKSMEFFFNMFEN